MPGTAVKLACSAYCLTINWLCVAGAAADVLDFRLYPAVEYTRLVYESRQEPIYRLSIVENPDRLVLDLFTANGDVLLDRVRNRELSSAPYLSSIRAARFDDERLRIVFDLSSEVKYSLFALEPIDKYGHRVVLDVSPRDPQVAVTGLLSDLGFSGLRKPALSALLSIEPLDERPFVVMIDAGHGGEDPGAINDSGLREKYIVLDIAKKVYQQLLSYPQIKPLLTRNEDIFLPLATRVRLAQQTNTDLFLSIHADSFNTARPRGASVFVLSRKGASSRLAQTLATHANLSDRVGGINIVSDGDSESLDAALTEIYRDGKERASRDFASIILSHLGTINEIHGKHVHSAGFAVLKSPVVPSVLVETGFLSNPHDAKLLADPDFRTRIANQIAAAVLSYHKSVTQGINN